VGFLPNLTGTLPAKSRRELVSTINNPLSNIIKL
jgi:hypothetical protein